MRSMQWQLGILGTISAFAYIKCGVTPKVNNCGVTHLLPLWAFMICSRVNTFSFSVYTIFKKLHHEAKCWPKHGVAAHDISRKIAIIFFFAHTISIYVW